MGCEPKRSETDAVTQDTTVQAADAGPADSVQADDTATRTADTSSTHDSAPEPEDTTPVPKDTTPVPEDTTPVPQDTAPEPQDTTPEPQDTAPEPQDTTPTPQDTTPEPQDTTPEPQDTTPEPQDTTPEPQDTAPPLCTGDTDCDDKNPCTADSCDPTVGCIHVNSQSMCDDGDLCTTEDFCISGGCVGTNPLPCGDSNPCTDDTCTPTEGCTYTNVEGACDDGDSCTNEDLCDAGSCKGQEVACDDKNPCTTDACAPGQGCTYTNNDAVCDDDDPCTADDLCDAGTCAGTAVDCKDGIPCTADVCTPVEGEAVCSNTPIPDCGACDEEAVFGVDVGEHYRSLHRDGKHLYAGTVDGIRIYDISTPTDPVLIESTSNGRIDKVFAQGDRIATRGVHGLQIYIVDPEGKITDISAPLPLEKWVYGPHGLIGDTLILSKSGGLYGVDISDPMAPALLGPIGDLNQSFDSLGIEGTIGVTAHSLTTPGELIGMGTITTTRSVLDLSDPTAPKVLWTTTSTVNEQSGWTSAAAVVEGNIAYFRVAGTVSAYDISTPSDPQYLGGKNFEGGCDLLQGGAGCYTLYGDFAAGSGFAFQTQFWTYNEPGTPNDPEETNLHVMSFGKGGGGTFSFCTNFNEIAFTSDYAYAIGCAPNQIKLLSLPPNAPFKSVQNFATAPPTPPVRGVVIRGNIAFLSRAGYGFTAADITDPTSPNPLVTLPGDDLVISPVPNSTQVWAFTPSKWMNFPAIPGIPCSGGSGDSEGIITVYDGESPSKLKAVASWNSLALPLEGPVNFGGWPDEAAHAIAVGQDRVALITTGALWEVECSYGGGSPHLHILELEVDVMGKAGLVLKGSVQTDSSQAGFSPRDIVMVGNMVYMTAFNKAEIRMADITQPTKPEMVGKVQLSGQGISLLRVGSTLVISTKQGLELMDIGAPAAPVITGDYPLQGIAHLAPAQSGLIVATVGKTVHVFDITGSHPQPVSSFEVAHTIWDAASIGSHGLIATGYKGLRVHGPQCVLP